MAGTWNSSWKPQMVTPYVWGPRYRTLVTRFEDGGEQRRQKNTNAIRGFRLVFNALDESTLNAIKTFFHQRKGAYDSFTFTNPHDSQAYTVRFTHDELVVEDKGAGVFGLTVDLMEVL